jgi:hypothetical protein
MAVLFADGFDTWGTATQPGPWNSVTYGGGSTAGGIYTPASSTNSFGVCNKGFTSSGTLIINFRMALTGVGGTSNCPILVFYDGGTIQCSLVVKNTGKLAFFRGTSTAQLGSDSTFTLSANSVQQDFEVKIVFGNTGSCELKVNNVSDITASSVDNTATANNTANSMDIGKYSSPTYGLFSFDHCIIMDSSGSVNNDFIGPKTISTLLPTADGNYTDWTANTGDRWAAIDDATPDSDTTYISAATVGNKYTAVMGNLGNASVVNAVCLQLLAKKDDASTREISHLLRYSGVDANGANQVMATGYTYLQNWWQVSPFSGGSTAWTKTEVDGLEAGIEVEV